jgi:monofunctional glycosyltransferase
MKRVVQFALLCVVAFAALQLFFVLRVLSMLVIDPQSTAFQRSEAARIVRSSGRLPWRQEWLGYEKISDHLKRAVIASEDSSFTDHEGVDWEAVEKAWEKNAKLEAAMAKKIAKAPLKTNAAPPKPLKIIGGSTITQQLAKNLLLSGERSMLRKAQELVLTYALEYSLGKQRILEIYLNNVEWGEGVFGAEAAARHYFRKSASQLSAYEAARLAVMLPRPKYFEKRAQSGYLAHRASTIVARMSAVDIP